MKFAQRLMQLGSILLLLCTPLFGQEELPSVEGVRPTVRQWNEFQETQEKLLKENQEIKGRMLDLLAGQRDFRTRLEKINNNLFNLINIVNETNNVNIGGDNCPFMGSKDKSWFQGTLYGLSALGVVSVFVWFTGLFRKKNE